MQRKLLVCGMALAVVLGGCGDETSGADAESEAGAAERAESAAEVPEEAMAEEKIFAEGAGDDKCEFLTSEDVAAATGLPPEQIEQRSVVGACVYSWDDGSIYFGSARVNDSLKRAQATFARETKDATAEEVEGAKEEGKEMLAEKRDEGELTGSEADLGSGDDGPDAGGASDPSEARRRG